MFGLTAQPNISLAKVMEFPIPVPSLAGQRRIVAKVDELMAVIDAALTAENLFAATTARIHAA